MIGFRRPLSVFRPCQHIEERLTLIIDFHHLLSGFFSSEAFIGEPPSQYRMQLITRHISEIAT